MNLTAIVLILTAYFLTVAGVGWWRRVALRRQILDVPNERSSHALPTPRGGGIVITSVTLALLVLGAWLGGNALQIAGFVGGAILIAVVSWFDDLYGVPRVLRFGVHFVAALLAVFSYGFFNRIEVAVAEINLDYLAGGQILTVLWIVGLTNAYNFMDGIDGIAGAQGVIAGAGWCLIGILTEQPLLFLIGGLLAAACAGFLWHNWHPAKIFMGDVSSAFLGYSFAVIPLLAINLTNYLPIGSLAVTGVLLVWTFVFDASFTFWRRALNKENVFAAHRSHLYQRLVIAGWRHDAVTTLYAAGAFGGAVAALTWTLVDRYLWTDAAIFLFLLLGATSLYCGTKYAEQRKANHSQTKETS